MLLAGVLTAEVMTGSLSLGLRSGGPQTAEEFVKSYIADRSGGPPAASSIKGPASRQTFPSPIEGLRWTVTV